MWERNSVTKWQGFFFYCLVAAVVVTAAILTFSFVDKAVYMIDQLGYYSDRRSYSQYDVLTDMGISIGVFIAGLGALLAGIRYAFRKTNKEN